MISAGVLLVATSLVSTSGHGQVGDRVSVDNLRMFMREKLDHSQQILEGLTTENFEMIAKSSQELSLLSLASNWQVLQTPEYVNKSSDFRRATDALSEAAREKNLDGATLAYLEMTLKCVNCHKYVRHVRKPGKDGPIPKKREEK